MHRTTCGCRAAMEPPERGPAALGAPVESRRAGRRWARDPTYAQLGLPSACRPRVASCPANLRRTTDLPRRLHGRSTPTVGLRLVDDARVEPDDDQPEEEQERQENRSPRHSARTLLAFSPLRRHDETPTGGTVDYPSLPIRSTASQIAAAMYSLSSSDMLGCIGAQNSRCPTSCEIGSSWPAVSRAM